MSGPAPLDVLIVGAGLSGIGMAHHLQRRCPWATYAILESRHAIGGTWDLFRYPGIRSDSDMHTLGYSFRPWREGPAIAGGAAIRRYIEETAEEAGIHRHIRFGVRVTRAAWSSADRQWTVETDTADGPQSISARFLIACCGYYSYAQSHRPIWPGEQGFGGPIVHPQSWPGDLAWQGKRIAVIGSGATAVTLVPALAGQAAHVTMVQRSPSYVAARPAHDRLAALLQRRLPHRTAGRLNRWKNVLVSTLFYQMARRRPARTRAKLIDLVRAEIGEDQLRHFSPAYDPWDQRLCLAPDGDLFAAIRSGRASVATGAIERFTPSGLRLATGEEVPADIVVTATGLKLNLIGDIALTCDGQPVNLARTTAYKGVMFGGVPNIASIFGYTNASWTLKADLAAAWLCRVLNRMHGRGDKAVVPRPDPAVIERPFLSFTSGYVQRALDILPRQGDRGPWRLPQSYLRDVVTLRLGRIADGVLSFSR